MSKHKTRCSCLQIGPREAVGIQDSWGERKILRGRNTTAELAGYYKQADFYTFFD